jgi:hypothetical protein
VLRYVLQAMPRGCAKTGRATSIVAMFAVSRMMAAAAIRFNLPPDGSLELVP